MAKIQQRPVAGPHKGDRDNLLEFAAVLQSNFSELFETSHDHLGQTTPPTENEGRPGDILYVDDGAGTIRLYFKTQTGWHYVTATA